jgi:hypothetical protein
MFLGGVRVSAPKDPDAKCWSYTLALSAAPDIPGLFRYLGISKEDCNEHLGLCADASTTDITIA